MSRLATAVVFLCVAACVAAQTPEADETMLDRALRTMSTPASALDPQDIALMKEVIARQPSETQRAEFEALRDQAQVLQREALQAPAAGAPPTATLPATQSKTLLLFVSQSMGQAGLSAALASVRGDPHAAVVLRGVLPGQTLGDLQRLLLRLAGPVDADGQFPGIMIDPVQFSKHDIRVAPTLVWISGEEQVAQVRGLTSLDWFRARVLGGMHGDHGQRGETSDIAERDMIETMQEAAARIDWSQAQDTALASYWDSLDYFDLPTARAARVREVDPSFVVTEGVTTPDGVVLAYPGQIVNPLDHAPFLQRLIVFDATDSAQRALVVAAIEAAGDRRVTLITTRYSQDAGWEGLGDLWKSYMRPVYLLKPDIKERFAIERVPSIVEAQGRVFRVTELAVPLQAGEGAGE